MRGTKPLPENVLRMRGTYRSYHDARNEPEVKVEAPEPPDHLDTVALIEWVRISRELLSIGLLTCVDRTALSNYCVLYSSFVEVSKRLNSLDGEYDPDFTNEAKRVCRKELIALSKEIKALLVEFGMTPSSRTRVNATKTDDAPKKVGFGKFKKLG